MLIIQSADKDPIHSFSRGTVVAAIPPLHLPPHPFPPILKFLSILWFFVTPDKVAAEFPSFERVRFGDGVDVAVCSGFDGLAVGSSA